MTMHRSLLALALSVPLGAAGCANEPQAASTTARRGTASTTTGDQRRAEAQRESVATADQDRTSPDEMERAETERMEREGVAPSAMDQSNAPADLEITRQIRAAVVSDSALSVAARNVTIITRDSVVTLRGNVSSNAERDRIDHHARQVAGVRRVENMLDVDDTAE